MTFARSYDSPNDEQLSVPIRASLMTEEDASPQLTAAFFLSFSFPPLFAPRQSLWQSDVGERGTRVETSVPKDTRDRRRWTRDDRENAHESNTDDRLRFLASRGPAQLPQIVLYSTARVPLRATPEFPTNATEEAREARTAAVDQPNFDSRARSPVSPDVGHTCCNEQICQIYS